jgi:methyltransferase (TIGR00027 family)
MRAVETNRSEKDGRLFEDPYAEILAGEEGKKLLLQAVAHSGDQPAIAIRTAFMDQKITKAIGIGVRQFVFLAAGMDTRAYRLAFSKEATIYELDRKEVQDYKALKLKEAKPHGKLNRIATDLKQDWRKSLLDSGFQKGNKTLWLVEGLLMYLKEADVLSLFEKINSMAYAQDLLLFDILSQTLLEVPHMKKQLEFLKSIGAPWYFGVNDPVDFMNNLGWKATLSQPGDFAPSRWPYPSAPLHIPNIPRGYYVEAVRSEM